MPTLQDIKNQIVSQASEQGLKSGALFEFEGNRMLLRLFTSVYTHLLVLVLSRRGHGIISMGDNYLNFYFK